MNRALCWKEWREHRQVWLAVAVLAGLLAGLPALIASGYLSGAGIDHDLARALSTNILLFFAAAYGIVAGALMFAGEREAGTQDFLDNLTGLRSALWASKCTTGILLVVAQALFLEFFSRLLGTATVGTNSWSWAGILLLLSVDCFAWGLCGSALCRSSLAAVAAAAGLCVASWLPAAALLADPQLNSDVRQTTGLGVQVCLTAGAVVVSRRRYCRTDRERCYVPMSKAPSLTRALLWLTWRQGKRQAAILGAAAVLLGLLAPVPLLWPGVTLVAGVLCGVQVFSGDRANLAYRFLASQRPPAGHVWRVKVFSGLARTAGFTLLAFGIGAVLLHESFFKWLLYFRFGIYEAAPGSEAVFLILWPLYGFALGQLCGQLFPRQISAVTLGLLAGVMVSILWVPSLLNGGLGVWQVLGLPVVLLVATRLGMWAWFGERLSAFRPLLGLAGCCLLALGWIAGMFWYRVAEVPDLGTPFDVEEFLAGLPTPEQNKAGNLIRQAAEELPLPHVTVQGRMGTLLNRGWPEEESDLGSWLDGMFERKWAKTYEEAARLPLGMVFDPRMGWPEYRQTYRVFDNCTSAGDLFAARALQLQVRGEEEKALDHLFTALALSRQLRHLSIEQAQLRASESIEKSAFQGFEHWLNKLGPRTELLRRALEGLSRHEVETPALAGSLKAAYVASLVVRTDSTVPYYKLHWLAELAPWEKARNDRLRDAIFASELRFADLLAHEELRRDMLPPWPKDDELRSTGLRYGTNFLKGRGANLGIYGWGRLLYQSSYVQSVNPYLYSRPSLYAVTNNSRCRVRGARLQVALALYQVEQGRPAASLDDLVPRYLSEIPLDPYTGRPFGYRISGGEEIKAIDMGALGTADLEDSRRVAPGQGVVWCQPNDFWVVPLWRNEP